jgi:DNA-binding HxlR family transcriptional regulator
MGRSYEQNCPIAKTLEIIGDRWTMLVVRELVLHGERRFADLERGLPGIAPNVLSERLKVLEDAGLVRREIYSQRPLRASYHLTESGKDLRMVAGALAEFGSQHLMEGARLTHARSGHTVAVGYFCPDCGERVEPQEVWPEIEGVGYTSPV